MTGQPEVYHADLTACDHGTDPGQLAAPDPVCRAGQPVGWVQAAFDLAADRT